MTAALTAALMTAALMTAAPSLTAALCDRPATLVTTNNSFDCRTRRELYEEVLIYACPCPFFRMHAHTHASTYTRAHTRDIMHSNCLQRTLPARLANESTLRTRTHI